MQAQYNIQHTETHAKQTLVKEKFFSKRILIDNKRERDTEKQNAQSNF